ncbi:MAG: nickel pincer cofactor biosynthesis protein LarC, partial [Clostridia bacterium]|nr:nickel pincer cofactor biosynthesis protein LarC [Clostridia bacterium]
HAHEHEHSHEHRGLADIERIVTALPLSASVKADVMAVYALIAEAESHAHGVPVADIHFHEVGTLDAIADITAVCLLMERLAPQQVVVSPVHLGSGHVRCAHGILPVPAPATAHILRGVPVYGGSIRGELCTPTGAALLKRFATRFGNMPVMTLEKTGYGMGKKDFEAANCVRALLGDAQGESESVLELNCNVDDMTAEELGFAMERLFDAGALEVFTTPIGMKKSRPGVLLRALCRTADRYAVVEALFKHTSTLGVRETACARYVLKRTTTALDTPYGQVRRKDSSGYGVSRSKCEYEDVARIALDRGISLREARKLIEG